MAETEMKAMKTEIEGDGRDRDEGDDRDRDKRDEEGDERA